MSIAVAPPDGSISMSTVSNATNFEPGTVNANTVIDALGDTEVPNALETADTIPAPAAIPADLFALIGA